MDKDIKWKSKLQDLLSTCQEEIIKTTTIGKKMLHASKINSGLNNSYQTLGVMLVEAIQRKEISWDDPKIKKLLEDIERFKVELSAYEEEVNQIKKENGGQEPPPKAKTKAKTKKKSSSSRKSKS